MAYYVLKLSNDLDIRGTEMHESWGAPTQNFTAQQCGSFSEVIPHDATLVIIAHGDPREIGDADPTGLTYSPQACMAIIQRLMRRGAQPAHVYVSACSRNHATFAAALSNAADELEWTTAFYGHETPVSGKVPAAGSREWTPFYPNRR